MKPNNGDTNGDGVERRTFIGSSLATGMLFAAGGIATAVDQDEDKPERNGETVVSSTSHSDQQVDEFVDVISTNQFNSQVTNTEYLGEDIQINSFSQEIQEFPQEGSSHLILSSGQVNEATEDPETFVSSDVNGRYIPNYSPDNYDAYDVAEIRIDFTIPEEAEGLKFDYQFASEESPTFLDSDYQDFFEALLFFPDGNVRNIGLLPNGQPVTVENASEYSNIPNGPSQSPDPPLPEPPDIAYNAVTELLTAESSLSGYQGQEARIVIRIADATDEIFDSAILIDNLRFAGDIENPLLPVEEALNNHRDTLVMSMRKGIQLEAETEAKVYNTRGTEYAETFVNYLGYKAGEVNGSELDDDIRELLDQTTVQTDADTQADFQTAYDFYSELYAQAENVPAQQRADLFEQYLLGTHPDQSNYLTYSGKTAEEALTDYENDVFPDYKSAFMQELQQGEYTNAEIQDIVAFINSRTNEVESALGRSERLTNITADSIGDEADLLGKDFGIEIEETEGGQVGAQGLVTGIVVVGAIALKKVGAAAALAKGYTALKSAAAGAKVVSIIKGSSIATKAAGALSGPETAAVTALKGWFAHGTPPSASLLSKHGLTVYGKWGSKKILGSYLWETVIGDVPEPTPTGLATWSLETVVDEIKEQREVDGGAMPQACIEYQRSEATITDFSVSDVNITDAINADLSYYYEDGWYGVETGSITIQNTGSVALTPSPQMTITAVDTAPVGKDEETQYPVVFNDAIPTLEPGEEATVKFEYVMPLEVWGASTYRMTAELENSATAVTEQFDTGITSVDLPSFNFLSGQLATGQSAEETYTPASDAETSTFELTYDAADLDLHLRDEQGNHTGMNYETNEFENQIPNVIHSGNDEGRIGDEYATIQEIQSNEYSIEIVAREVGTVIQEQNTTDLVTGAQNGSIDSEFDVNTTEVSESAARPKMNITVEAVETDSTETDTLAQANITEVNQTGSLDDVQINADTLTSTQTDDTIPASNIALSESGFTVEAGSTNQLTVEITVPQGIERVQYTGELQATANGGDVMDTAQLSVTISEAGDELPPIVGNTPPKDIHGDGLYRDIDGNGEFTVVDVQLFFENRDDPVIQNNSKLFNFDGKNPATVTISDVQALFRDLIEGDLT